MPSSSGKRSTLLLVLGAVLAAYYVLPLGALFSTQPLGEVWARLSEAAVRRAALLSLGTSAVTVLISLLFGVPLAHTLARSNRPWARLVTALVALPLVLPPIVSGMLLLSLFSPGTGLGGLLADAGLPLTRSFAAVVLAQTFVASPFVVVTSKAAFEGVPARYAQTSRLLGKSAWATLRHVTLPMAWPGIAAGVVLTFARAMGEFGATIMMAYYPRTMPVEIWVAFTTQGLDRAFPIAVLLALLALVALALLSLLGTPFRTT